MVLDKTIGAIIIVVSIIWHLYYTIWILVTPWLETSQDLAHWLKYFPDRYYGLAIPALLLAFIKIAFSLIMLSFSIIGNYNPFLRIAAFLLGLLIMFV